MSESIERLLELSNAFGPSGFEEDVLELLRDYLKDTSYVLEEDKLRNLYAKKEKKGALIVQLDAHTDEVGFMVQSVLSQGLMRLAPLGGWLPAQVSSLRLMARNNEGDLIPGIIGSKPPHFASDLEKAPSLSEMAFDVGATSKDELWEKYGLGIAVPMVPHVYSRYDEKRQRLFGKAFDCRIGVAALVDTLLEAEKKELDLQLIGTFSSQEEVGLKGATVSSRRALPDLAIIFEGAPADDTFPGESVQCALGKGPMLRHMDKSMIVSPRFQHFALDIARELEIPHQEAVRLGGGTNAAAIQLVGAGVPCIVLGVPVRYIHAGEGIAHPEDLQSTVQLALAILERLTPEIVSGF